ncbi:MAG: dTDP-4-dehydrorhamnose 3,5-epimerase family protein [Nitriliruptor sp.]|uniref:dTDP-4-dehydrorhamnose 3,5-epimerase family protein n=1 Tax=Nitriliruptor sp. TaxID=2448056 RepID=UPI0034A0230B
MPVEQTAIAGLLVVRWDTHGDERGFFRQTYQVDELTEALGREPVLRQGNHSRSGSGVLRGFHAEPWDKLVYVARGTAFCAVADPRPDSPTFGDVVTFTLGDAPGERLRLFVTEGLANGFCTLTDTDYLYDVGGYWSPDVDKRAIAWDDADLAVDWPVSDPTISVEDRSNPTLRDRFPDHPRFASSSPGWSRTASGRSVVRATWSRS